ncbi:MAG: peptidoglycan DD-metalloendopeptidase family protein [candidate division NC10 bacterium]|nr:peptidoglycan DD-metalloendopeptidase family protein [candidate division NC10 bacterium]
MRRCWHLLVPVVTLLALMLAVPNAVGGEEGFVPPTDLQARQSGRSVELTWNPPAVGQAWGYNIYRSDASNGPWTRLNDELVGQTTYLDRSPLSGTSYYAVSAVDEGQNETGQTPPSGVTFFSEIASDVSSQAFSLTHFPLQGLNWQGAYNAKNSRGEPLINSVFDHSMESSYEVGKKCPRGDTSAPCVIAFTGEVGDRDKKCALRCEPLDGNELYAYGKSDETPFSLNESYRGSGGDNLHLYYDSHPGYDYSTDGVPRPVYAAATGKTVLPSNCQGVVILNHTDGYKTYYFHLSSFDASIKDPNGGYKPDVTVNAGDPIGLSGNKECDGDTPLDNNGNLKNVHLHFEVRKTINGVDIPVDPYGWEGHLYDPYKYNPDQPGLNVNLWGRCTDPNKFSGAYFATKELTGAPTLVRCDDPIDFDWGGGAPPGLLSSDHFSVRWTKTVSFAAGTYTFTTVSDDGVRLYIDGTLVLDNWTDHPPTSDTATRTLTGGEHQIKLEYYENTGGAVARLSWAPGGGGPCDPAQLGTNQLVGCLYDNTTLAGAPQTTAPAGPTLASPVPSSATALAINWHGEGPNGTAPDTFSIRWKGTFTFSAGTYTFTAGADDGVRLKIDGTTWIDDWSDHGYRETSQSVALTGGSHLIEVEYYENTGGARVEVRWAPGGGEPPGAFSVNAFPDCNGSSPAIRLSWSISSNATSFEVYRNGVLLVGNLPNSAGSYVDTSVSGGTTYTYFIRARNDSASTDSNTVQFTAPTNCVFTLTAQPECSGTVSQIRLRWSVPPTSASSYEIFRNGVSIFSTVNSNLTEYVDSGVSPGASYNYFVRASTSAGLRDSTGASATALNCGSVPPGQFTLSATPECSNNIPQIRLTWTSSTGVDFYQVLRNGIVLEGVGGTTTTFLDTAVTAGTTYNYVVRAINSGGQTDSNSVSTTASCGTPPGAFILTVTPWCTGSAPVNLLEWTGSAGRTFPYEVYRNGSPVFTTDLSRYDDTAVTAGTSYSYVVRARNSVGSSDSNTVIGTAKTDCAVPVAPVIGSINPSSVTVGGGSFTLTLTGSNFDSTTKVLWAFAGQTPTSVITPTFVDSSTLTIQVTQDSGGFSPFSIPGVLAIQVLKPGPNFWDGQRSNTVQFTIFNPSPAISSISGTCQAGLNCTPSNGFDVRIFGSGFVNNIANIGGSFVESTTLDINGAAANKSFLGQGPVYSQMQLFANGTLIPTAGTYTVRVCNAGTSQGTACSTGSLTVTP